MAIAGVAAAAITVWRVQADRATDAERQAQAQAVELARADRYFQADYTGHRAPVDSVAFAPDGLRAVSVDERGDARIWDTANGRGIGALHADGELLQAAFSPDGSLVAAAGVNGEAIVWRWQSGERLADHHEPFALLGASFDHDGPILDAQGGVVRSAAFSRDGRLLVAGSDDGDVRVWDWRHERVLADLPTHGNTVYTAAFSPDGRFVASGGQDSRVRVWDWRARRVVWSPPQVNDQYIESVAFSPDGRLVAAAHGDGVARVWDWRRRRLVVALRGHSDAGQAVAFSPDGCLVATAGYSGAARIWKPPLPGCRR